MDLVNQMAGGAMGGSSVSGSVSMTGLQELQKALTAGYGSDAATLEGGGALRIQSLDKTLMAVVQENQHFALFNALPKENAGATVDEWTEQDGIGGFMGGSTNTELGIIREATGEFARRVGFVKFLMAKRQVSLVQTLQGAIAEAEAVEQVNGTKQLLTDAEFLCFEGDSRVVPTEFDGVRTQIESLGSNDHIIDAEAQSLSSINAIVQAAAVVSGFGNFGTPTDLYMSPGVGADLDVGLDPAYRVPLPNGQESKRGTPIRGIVTAQGDIAIKRDVFIRGEDMKVPFELTYPILAAENNFTPSQITVDSTNSDTESKFGAVHSGNYYYFVTGVNAEGQSIGLGSAQVLVAAGKKVVITVNKSVSGKETGYVIYRSRKNGTNATNDVREMARVPRNGDTTVVTDLNREIPGTSTAFMFNLTAGDHSITWRQLLPMMKFPLAAVNQATIPWAQLLFGYLRLAKRRHHMVIKNILPTASGWKPFG
ncbi:MAG: hypothetical protein HN842_09265 [Gammaproteobacteria bacterium]|nr:hypothetical protein [Gammaproteobacteria bacterium]